MRALLSQWLIWLVNLWLFTLFWQTRFRLGSIQIVDYLIPFVYLSDLFILLILAVIFCYEPRWWLVSWRKHPFFWRGAALFLLLSFSSNLSAQFQLIAWFRWIKLLLFLLLGAGVVWWVNHWYPPAGSRQTRLQPWLILNWGLTLEAVIALGEFVRQASLGLQILGEWRFSSLTPGIAKVMLYQHEFLRPYATFPHPNVLGATLAIFLSINIYLLLEKRMGLLRQKLMWAAMMFLQSLALFLAFSRVAWFCFLFNLILISLIKRRRISKIVANIPRRKLYSFIFLLCFILGFLAPLISQRVGSLLATDIISPIRRGELIRAAWLMIKDHPLTGVGFNNFVVRLEDYKTISGQGRFLQPVHNLWLLVASEAGVPALLVAVSGVIYLIYGLIQRYLSDRSLVFILLIFWLSFLITSLFDHYWWTAQVAQLLFWLTLGVSLVTIREEGGLA